MGFVVQRRYEAIDDPEDVYQDSDGAWHIKAGARVRVKITMVADNRRYHVALVDPLPAGLEIVNPALAVSKHSPGSQQPGLSLMVGGGGDPGMSTRTCATTAPRHLPLCCGMVSMNTHTSARATTPGTFVVPPAKAEEMYSPEVFGRSGSDMVIVE